MPTLTARGTFMEAEMKKIAIISNIPLTADNHKVVLESIFPNTSIEVFPVSETLGRRINADAALVTAMDIVPYAQKYLTPGAAIVQCGYTLLKEQLEAIRRLSRGGPVTVVHENRRAAMTRRILLQRLGLSPDSLRVWYPGLGEEKLTDRIVLFSDVTLPQGRRADYQVRGRMLNASAIFELALCLGIHDITSVPAFTSYCQRVCTQFSPSIDDLSVSELDTMVGNEAPQRGLVAFTQALTIFYCDAYAASLMGRPSRELIGRQLFEAFPFLRSCEIHRGDEAREQLVVQEGKTYAVKLNQVVQTGQETGYLQISDYWAEEQRQGNLRRQVKGKIYLPGHCGCQPQAQRVQKDCPADGPFQLQCADHRGHRRGQGAVRPIHSQRLPPEPAALCGGQLRRHCGKPAGERAFWLREGGVYRGQQKRQAGAVRAGAQGYPVPG